ncbi:hypothetical protein Q8A73_013226 [Channa argus]|nr:hypothetical protein Q8A73_013226 [Channa argus]
MKWQLLFPQQPCSNHSGETRVHPPLEENETRSKHSSPEGGTGGVEEEKEQGERNEKRQTAKMIESHIMGEKEKGKKAAREGGVSSSQVQVKVQLAEPISTTFIPGPAGPSGILLQITPM